MEDGEWKMETSNFPSSILHPPSSYLSFSWRSWRLGGSNDCRSPFRRALDVTRLVQLNLNAARHAEESHEAVAAIDDWVGELDAAALQLHDGLLDVVTVEGNI